MYVNQRGTSNVYDHYFSCRACGQSLQWRVNDEDVGSHSVANAVGQVRYRIDSNGKEIKYLSRLLSRSNANSEPKQLPN